jgi:hypothetical protein
MRRGCTFFKFGQIIVAEFKRNLAGFDTFTIFEAHGMAGMDSEQIIGSCNAAGCTFFKMGQNIVAGMNGNLAGSILRRYSRPQRHGGDGQ